MVRHALLLPLALTLGAAPAAAAEPAINIEYERYTLDNGLEVILHRDASVPLVATNLWYHVGSGDETPGKSGFAHLFEHMMFQGAKHIGKDVHFKVLQEIGGTSINGTTNSDRTNYFEIVPSHQIETALWLESDRMGYLLDLLDETSLKNQQEVVRNERRQRYDNVPYGRDRFAVAEALYPEGHPYRFLTIGRHEDLETANIADVKSFFRQWYVSSNATLTLAGDFQPAQAKELVYTARAVDATEAKSLGLVSRVVPDAELESTALALATEFAESATYALALAKKMFQSMYVPTLEQLCEMETLASGIVRLTQDHKEGVAAFQEKRPPKFLGK